MSKNIEGIYNYCDRWCERCTFTSRCAVYEDETSLSPEETDIQNKAFWDRIGKNFSKAQELLQKAAEHIGLDLENVPEETPEEQEKKERIKTESREHPISKLTFQYSTIARGWLKTQPGMLERLDNLKAELSMGMESTEGARKKTETIKDSLSVIQWYMTFIHVKLVRALMSKLKDDGWEGENGLQRDCDGSAKIALIGIDRSIHAWSCLFDILREKEDDFLKILAMLQKVKTMVKEEFPEADAFVRPGFDD